MFQTTSSFFLKDLGFFSFFFFLRSLLFCFVFFLIILFFFTYFFFSFFFLSSSSFFGFKILPSSISLPPLPPLFSLPPPSLQRNHKFIESKLSSGRKTTLINKMRSNKGRKDRLKISRWHILKHFFISNQIDKKRRQCLFQDPVSKICSQKSI